MRFLIFEYQSNVTLPDYGFSYFDAMRGGLRGLDDQRHDSNRSMPNCNMGVTSSLELKHPSNVTLYTKWIYSSRR